MLLADDTPSHLEFVRTLRKHPNPRQTIRVQRIQPTAEEPGTLDDGQDNTLVNIRTRSLGATPPTEAVTIAVGAAAARVALQRPGNDPLLLTLISRLDYQDLRDVLDSTRARSRRISVQLRDPALAEQLRLMGTLLPTQRRLGVLVADSADPVLKELREVAAGWQIEVEAAPDAKTLTTALRTLLPRSDMLLILPNTIGNSSAATLTILQAANDANKPVFGTNEAMVRSGALAAVVSLPSQLSLQAPALADELTTETEGTFFAKTLTAAWPSATRLNQAVATHLRISIPSEEALSQKLGFPCNERLPAAPCKPMPSSSERKTAP